MLLTISGSREVLHKHATGGDAETSQCQIQRIKGLRVSHIQTLTRRETRLKTQERPRGRLQRAEVDLEKCLLDQDARQLEPQTLAFALP
jgi:hypothetical protein